MDAREKVPQAGALVIFGITGDLAKKQTFRALYRLEARHRMAKQVIAVARQDWSKEQLIERARQSIEGTGEKIDEAVFKRLAGRMSYLSGDLDDDGLATRETVFSAARREFGLRESTEALELLAYRRSAAESFAR